MLMRRWADEQISKWTNADDDAVTPCINTWSILATSVAIVVHVVHVVSIPYQIPFGFNQKMFCLCEQMNIWEDDQI